MEQSLGKRIVANRKRLGLTQDQLAERLGVTAQAVSKWENDQSCPDITMLPKLAEIFGISTDALLGLAEQPQPPVHQAEVVTEDVGRDDGGKWELRFGHSRKGGLMLAIWILLTGGLLLASGLLGWGAGFWDILWPGGLLVFGLFGLFPKFSFFRLGCSLFGAYFLLSNLGAAPFALDKAILLPVFLLLFGLSLLVDTLKGKKKPDFQIIHDGKTIHTGEKKHSSHLTQEGTTFCCSSSFGEESYRIDLDLLTGGEADVSFGELTVDLSGCREIANNCALSANCSFGELTILVPAGCRVMPATNTSFASVSFRGSPSPDAATAINMDCDVSFGDITIRYI